MVSSSLLWSQPNFHLRTTNLVCRIVTLGLVVGLCIPAFSGTVASWLTGTVMQANEDAKSVKSQTDAFYRLAQQEIRAGNTDRAMLLLQEVLKLDPLHKKAKADLSKLSQAGVSIASAQTNQPLIVENLSAAQMIEVAASMMSDGEYDQAKVVLAQAEKSATASKDKKRIKSLIAQIQKDEERMKSVQDAALNYNLNELESRLQKGAIYLENNQFDNAEIELQRAKMIAPDDKRVDQLLDRVYKARSTQAQSQQKIQQVALDQEMKDRMAAADSIFSEGVVLYRQGQVIEAVQKWNQTLEINPDHQLAQTYLTNTQFEYEQALAARQAAEAMAAEEAEYEKKLDQVIPQYSTAGASLDIKNVLSTLSNLSGLNMVMGENLEGKVAFDFQNTTVRQVLNHIQKQYGFVWKRVKDTIYVERGFETRVFPLTEGQFKTLDAILLDPSILEDSSKNLRTILYGPGEEFNVPGKQLYLNRNTHSLMVTDTKENLRKVEAFLSDMPVIGADFKRPVETRTYVLDKEIAREIYEIIKLVLYQGQGSRDITDTSRQLYLEPQSSVLIVIDYPENIQKVEEILSQQQVTQQIKEGDLVAKQFQVTDIDDVEDTPEALTRRQEFVEAIANIIEQMLYGAGTREEARLQGRMIVPNPFRGTIDVVDTRQNIARVEDYLNTVRGEASQDIFIESYPIMHVTVFDIADALGYMFFDSQQTTRPMFLSQNSFQSIGTSETGDTSTDPGNIFEETTRNRFNLTGGGGGGTDLLQFLAVRFYPDINTNSIVVMTADQETLDLVSRIISAFDKPQRMVEIETRIVTVSLSDLRSINFDYVLTDPFLDKISLNPENMQQDLVFSTENQPGFNMAVHTFGRSRLDFIMNLLESTSSFNFVNSPKVLSVPNPIDPPLVFVGQQIPYADQVQFDDQGDDDPTNNRLATTFQRAFTGSMLPVIPFILNDDHLYLELAPNITVPGERLPVTISGTAPPDAEVPNIGPLTLNQSYIRASLRMKNDTTAVLGGLIQDRENEVVDSVPILSKIPFLGNLFIDRRIEKEKISTLFFVTARIIEPSL